MASGTRVLLVAGDPEFAATAADALETESDRLDSVSATSAAAGRERLTAAAIDCVVSTYRLPDADGLAFLEAVRETDPALPFVLLTDETGVASEALSAGATDVLRRWDDPEQYAVLAKRIEDAAARRAGGDPRRAAGASGGTGDGAATAVSPPADRTAALFEHATDCIAYTEFVDGEPIVRAVNPAFEETFGYDTEEVVGRSLDDVIVPPEREARAEQLSERARDGDPIDAEVVRQTADGPREFLLRSIYLDPDESGERCYAVYTDITDRKEHERRLERYETMANTAGDMVYILDTEGHFEFVNTTAERLTGYDRDQLQGSHVSQIMVEEDIEAGRELIKSLLAGETARADAFEWTLHTADGERIPCESQIALLYDDADEWQGTVGVVRDISERKRRETAIERLHEATREMMTADAEREVAKIAAAAAGDVLEFPNTGIFFYDPTTDALEPVAWSAAVEAIVGTPPTLGRGSIAWDVFESGESRRYADLETADPHNPDTAFRSEVLIPLGEFGVAIVGSTTPDAFDAQDERLVDLLCTNATTAIERTRRECELERNRDLLRHTERMADVGGWEVDLATDELRWTEGARRIRRVPDDRRMTLTEALESYHPEDRERLEEAIERCREHGEPYSLELRMETADGETRWVHVAGTAVEEGGEVTTLRGAIRDITDRKERERELRRQNERLDEFASVVSHDLRNPLEVAKSRLELVECDSEHLPPIDRSLDRMEELIDDTLALARQGKRVDAVEPTPLGTTARQAWETVETDAATSHIDADRTVEADPDRLRQLFENLFRNAIEHAGDDVTVTVGVLGDGFFVADDGPGVPEDERDQVFEPGYSSNPGGTGFGLTIVGEVANAHGWEVGVTDDPSGGARFEITGVTVVD